MGVGFWGLVFWYGYLLWGKVFSGDSFNFKGM